MTSNRHRCSAHVRTPLDQGWSVATGGDGADGISVVNSSADLRWVSVPCLGTVAAMLRDIGDWSIDDPDVRFDGQDWWFRRTFDAPELSAVVPEDHRRVVFLGLEGLATIASVWLNGELLLESSNMFIAHEIDVSGRLHPVGNELCIQFRSLDVALKAKRKRPRWRVPMLDNQQLRWIRTTLLGRAPGWSPPVAPVGPWAGVWMEVRHDVLVSNLRFRAAVEGGDGRLTGSLSISPLEPASIVDCQLILSRNGVQRVANASLAAGIAEFSLVIPQVDLWWPHTHGEAALYTMSIRVNLDGRPEPITIDAGRVGFRTIVVDSRAGDFSVIVNGVPVFCRGACWTPLDMASIRGSAAAYQEAILQLRDAGMNMVRVPGTTFYEADAFWDACDEAGVLVWQDFMFANMDYPFDDPDFSVSVDTEVRQQLGRIATRASLAVLCGNSEVAQQAAMWGMPKSLWKAPFFEATLSDLCAELAPDCSYWPSSAYGGSFPFQADFGTTSYYGVGAYLRPPTDARTSGLRFATECLAFANVPDDGTLERMVGGLSLRVHHANWKARTPRDLGAGWDFDDVRDHYLQTLWGIDPLKLRYSDHERYVQLSRVVTGELMAQAFSQWRRSDSACRGALMLFLRDLWAAPGWGVLDERGRPKPCFYILKRSLQPVFVGLSESGGDGLWVDVVNERPHAQSFQLELVAWRHGNVRAAAGDCTLELGPHQSRRINAQALFDHFIDFTHAYRFGPAFCDVVVATLRTVNTAEATTAFYWREPEMRARDTDLQLSGELSWREDGTVALKLCTNRIARYVTVDAPGYGLSDNYFHVVPDDPVTVFLRKSTNAMPTDCVVNVQAANAHQLLCLPLKATA